MASDNHAILDIGTDDLQFTTNDYKSKDTTSGGDAGMTRFPDPGPDAAGSTPSGGDGSAAPSGTSLFWTMSFYQQFFDVEDKDILNRVLYSMVPIPGKSFLQHHIRPKPDLYGPFWSCVTLIFSIAITGNIADYLTTSLVGQAKWHYDFHKVTLASTAVFGYAGLVPAVLYGYLWWVGRGGALAVSFLELLCLYGYSVTIYIPISILWVICVKVGWLQWILVLVGATLSGAVLFTTVWPAVREHAAKTAVIVMAVILSLHFLLATGFMLYFFHASASTAAALVNPATEASPSAAPAVPATPAALLQDKDAAHNIIEATKKNPAGDSADSAENVEQEQEQEPQDKEQQPAETITTKKVKKETESGEEQLNAVDTEAPPAADRRVAKDPGEETVSENDKLSSKEEPSNDVLATEPQSSLQTVSAEKNDDKEKSSASNESTPNQQETSQNDEKSLQNKDEPPKEEEKSAQIEEKSSVNVETKSSEGVSEEAVGKND